MNTEIKLAMFGKVIFANYGALVHFLRNIWFNTLNSKVRLVNMFEQMFKIYTRENS